MIVPTASLKKIAGLDKVGWLTSVTENVRFFQNYTKVPYKPSVDKSHVRFVNIDMKL